MPTAPLDSVEDVLNTARVRLNDAIQNLGGDILTDVAAFTLTAVNAGWRRLQEALVSYGIAWLKPETIFTNVPTVTSSDPGSQVYLDWSHYFDGSILVALPVLPQNLISPMIMWERRAGSNSSFLPMDKLDNGLPGVPKQSYNKSWEWRNGAIYMPGATAPVDLRLRYAAFYPDFILPTSTTPSTPYSKQPVPIVRALNAFAWFVCFEVSKARGDVDAGDFDAKAMMAAKLMWDVEPMQARSIQNEAEYTRMTDAYSATQGPLGPRGMVK